MADFTGHHKNTTVIKTAVIALVILIGNVWEWCIDTNNDSKPIICGGSCLSPPEHISPESRYEFETQACDVGFRIVIPVE